MEVLLRTLRQRPNGASDSVDTSLSADGITIGSAADSAIQLLGRSVAGRHALIQRKGEGLAIACRGRQRVIVGGQPCASRALAVGDVIEIGSHRLTILRPPSGFDAAIEIRPDAGVAASDFEAAFLTDLDQTALSKRAGSWLLALLALLVGLLVPLGTISLHRAGLPSPRFLPDDTSWSSGPLSAAHAHAAGSKCAACHQQLFIHVRDEACLECHKSTNAHVAPLRRALTKLGTPARCGECHVEHNGNAAHAALEDDKLCVTCHAATDTQFPALKVQRVSGFVKGEHAPFSVSLQKLSGASPAGLVDPRWVSYRVPLEGASEQSNLKFSHAQHLDPDKVTTIEGRGALGCGDCHILAADGQHFQPLSMSKSCSSCHTLNFDITAPNRQLPHGKPQDAMLMIEDYFARKYTDPAPQPVSLPTRRLPDLDRDPSRNVAVDTCSGPAIECARRRARAEIENQFNNRGCVGCHVVIDTKSADMHERYQVTPIRLGLDYFPHVRFSHKAHAIQGKLSGDAACESCHAARKSTRSSELLLPGLDGCLRCHRDRRHAGDEPTAGAGGKLDKIVALQCISCHEYHPAAVLSAGRTAVQQ